MYFCFANNIKDTAPVLIAHIDKLFHNFSTFQAPNNPTPMIPAFAHPKDVYKFSFRTYLVVAVAIIVEADKDNKA